MITHTVSSYIFIRTCIFFIHYAIPLLIALCIIFLSIPSTPQWLTHMVEILAIIETAFYVLVYLPRKRYFQRAAVHPEVLPQTERRKLFQLAHDSLPDGEAYLRKWFCNAELDEIKRENLKEFFCWAFLSKGAWGPADEEELNEYVDAVEAVVGRKLEPGWGNAIALRLTLDPIDMLHRPLLWYMAVAVVDTKSYLTLLYHRFHFHRLPLSRTLSVFPPRPLTLTTTKISPSQTVSYWHRPHTSPARLPLLFIHGIGIGLYPYIPFLAALNSADKNTDGDIGILAIEIMPISFRLTGEIQDKDALVAEIVSILDKQGFNRFVLMSHSYGSVISTHLIKTPSISSRIASVVLADPVSFLLHLPDVAYNFTRRKPHFANEWQLYFFASMDMGVAQTLARHFFWLENILWKEDLGGRNVTVVLGGHDLIVDSRSVGRYLVGEERAEEWVAEEGATNVGIDDWANREWKGEGIDVLWFEKLDHAQTFEHRKYYQQIVDVVRAYCADV